MSVEEEEILASRNYQYMGDESEDGYTSSSSEWESCITRAKTKAKKVKMERWRRPYVRSNSTISTSSNKAVSASVATQSIQSDTLEANQSQNKPVKDSTIINNFNLSDIIQSIQSDTLEANQSQNKPVKDSTIINTVNLSDIIQNIQSDTLEANQSQNKPVRDSPIINLSDILQIYSKINDMFTKLLGLLNQVKLAIDYCEMPLQSTVNLDSAELAVPVAPNLTADIGLQTSSSWSSQSLDEFKQNDNNISENEEFNSSDDNVLITNKYNTVSGKTTQENEAVEQEWFSIGGGKIKIHKDKYKKINWKSYTTATRTLLLALFPRKVLATHSLTGKPSPAFRNKPPKMSLDQNKISAVIMEVVNRFKVGENLVRNIITTKCADECKMWKSRCKKNASDNKENTESE